MAYTSGHIERKELDAGLDHGQRRMLAQHCQGCTQCARIVNQKYRDDQARIVHPVSEDPNEPGDLEVD